MKTSLVYGEQLYPSLKEYIRGAGVRPSRGDGPPPYAHPVDTWILKTLESSPVKAVLQKAMDAYVSFAFGNQLASAVFIDRKSFPEIFDVLSHCARTLGIPVPHAAANHDPSLFNAYTAGTDEYSFICISTALLQFFSREEASFVIGHECGHIAARHMLYHTAVTMLSGHLAAILGPLGAAVQMAAGLPLNAWSRRSEITADRAGLLCCGDIEVAERALLKLVTGFADADRVDIEDYLRRSRGVEEFHKLGKVQELFQSHPLIPKRIEALRLFTRSELYYQLTERSCPETGRMISKGELDRRVSQIVKP
jgi:Zn-dependent protease with chaperone function